MDRKPRGHEEVLVFSRDAIRRLDKLAGSEFGIPSIVLMENAARHAADVALSLLEAIDRPRVLVVCGPGSNGGDGLAAARHLHNAAFQVGIALAGPPSKYTGDTATNLDVVQRMGLPVFAVDTAGGGALLGLTERLGEPDLILDAVFGTGLDRDVREPQAAVLGQMNELRHRGSAVLAVDIPSGLDADTGEPRGVAVAADVTVSFVGLKEGFLSLSAQGYLGEVVVADIGAPVELARRLGRVLALPKPTVRRPASRATRKGDSARAVAPRRRTGRRG